MSKLQKENRKVEAVLFDMDGLMFDTERMYMRAWKKVGEHLGIPIDDRFLIPSRGMIRSDSRKLFEELYNPDMSYDEIIAARQVFMEKELEAGIECKKGLLELLQFLKDKGYKIALATSTPRDRANRMLEETDTRKYFDGFAFGDTIEKGKPEPDIFLKAAEEVCTAPTKCLVLEDSRNGIWAGKKAGCYVIMIPDLVPATEEIDQILDAKFSDLTQVIDWLEKIN